jgi:hypothetical protein
MTDNTNFRAFWFGTNRILLNMLFHSNIMWLVWNIIKKFNSIYS